MQNLVRDHSSFLTPLLMYGVILTLFCAATVYSDTGGVQQRRAPHSHVNRTYDLRTVSRGGRRLRVIDFLLASFLILSH